MRGGRNESRGEAVNEVPEMTGSPSIGFQCGATDTETRKRRPSAIVQWRAKSIQSHLIPSIAMRRARVPISSFRLSATLPTPPAHQQ